MPFLFFLALAAAGVVVYEKTKASSAPPPAPTPIFPPPVPGPYVPPAPAPTGIPPQPALPTSPTALVTDSPSVIQSQNVANLLGPSMGGLVGLVNGVPSDPTLVSNLKLIQAQVNSAMSGASAGSSAAPNPFLVPLTSVFPLRTDGVLDQATYAVLLAEWASQSMLTNGAVPPVPPSTGAWSSST